MNENVKVLCESRPDHRTTAFLFASGIGFLAMAAWFFKSPAAQSESHFRFFVFAMCALIGLICLVLSVVVAFGYGPRIWCTPEGIGNEAIFGRRRTFRRWSDIGPLLLVSIEGRGGTERHVCAFSAAEHAALVAARRNDRPHTGNAYLSLSLVGMREGRNEENALAFRDQLEALRREFGGEAPEVSHSSDIASVGARGRRMTKAIWIAVVAVPVFLAAGTLVVSLLR